MSNYLERAIHHLRDPLRFMKWLWPEVLVYDKQIEMIRSVQHNEETFVVAGNELGKDFIAGFICVWFFCAHREVRIVTTSVKDDHLRVLWGEIGRFIETSSLPIDRDIKGVLRRENGGPLIVHHRDVRKVVNGKECSISYMRGMVSEKGEGMAGHHAEHTLAVLDEASGIEDIVYTQCGTWADKLLVFGNANPCQNFFFKAVEEGDIPMEVGV